MRNAAIIAVVFMMATILVDGDDMSSLQSTAPPSVIQSQIIPPTTESLIVFTHKGETLAVGQRTGKVTILGQGGGIVPPEPITPTPGPTVALTGLPKKVRDSFVDIVQQALQRKASAAVITAIDNTINQVGGLGLRGQAIINLFGEQMAATGANILVKGWTLGDLLEANGIDTDEKFLSALSDVKRAMETIR